MPRFSLVIPTLRRADTLTYALATLCNQRYDDVEIVVQNNGDDVETRCVVASVSDPRVRHFSTGDILPMTENWEAALSHCTGDFVTFIGDDDGLLPDACSIAANVFDAAGTDIDILTWEPFVYFWPKFFDPPRRNVLTAAVELEFLIQPQPSHPLLARFYDFEVHYAKLPMAYNSFVSRRLIERVQEQKGRYFFGSSPDVTSGIVNAWASPVFLKSSRPLSVAGLSHHSTGHRLALTDAEPPRDELERDFPLLAKGHGELPPVNLELGVAADMLLLRDTLFPEDKSITFNHRGLAQTVAAAINHNPSRYESTIAAIADLIDRYDIDPEAVVIPAKTERPRLPEPGAHVGGSGAILFVIDGDCVGLQSIDGAVRLASQLVPGVGELVWRADPVGAAPPTLTAEPLAFAKGGGGSLALVAGWSEQERWGTWSIERESVMRLQLPERAQGGPPRLGLRYRTIPLPGGAPRLVECAADGRTLHEWSFSEANAVGELVVELHPDAGPGVVELSFRNLNARPLAELGLGPDTRRLGIGVEYVRLLP